MILIVEQFVDLVVATNKRRENLLLYSKLLGSYFGNDCHIVGCSKLLLNFMIVSP